MTRHEVRVEVLGPWSLATSRAFWEGFAPAALPSHGPIRQLRSMFCVERDWRRAEVQVTQDGSKARVVVTGGGDLEAAAQACRFLSLDVDARGWPDVGRRDPVIADAQQQLPGLRPCGCHSPYEAATWSVLSQRIRIVQAARLRDDLVHRHGEGGAFPAQVLRELDLDQVQHQLGDQVQVIVADVSREDGAEAVAERLAAAQRDCRGLVAAAGGPSPTPPPGSGLAAVRRTWQGGFESNVLTAVLLGEVLRPALERSAGRVVLLSSIAALRGSGAGPYGAMKAALHAWMFDLATQLGAHGGTANTVAPGFVPDTGFWTDRLADQARTEKAAQTHLGRAGSPEEIASLIAWLLGPDGGWVTGQILSPNGGAVLGR